VRKSSAYSVPRPERFSITRSGMAPASAWRSAPATRPTPSCTSRAGNPGTLSAHYRDQYRDWLEARALPLAGKPVKDVLILKPAAGLGYFLAQLHPYQYTSSNEASQVP
jgi:hypothetical protein